MGSVQTKQQLPNQKNFQILDYGYCIVWKRIIDSIELMQEYSISIQTQQKLKAYKNMWSLRTKSSHFVNIYYFSHSQRNKFCGQIATGSIFTQRIPYRLSQLANVPLLFLVFILRKSLEGYSTLQSNYGLFYVKSTMIGFTQEYKIKMWHHTDFSQPQPQNPNCNDIKTMMVSVINAIESVGQYFYHSFPKFSQFLAFKDCYYLSKNFDLLLRGLDQYINYLKLIPSNDLSSLKYFKKPPEGWEKFKVKTHYPKLLSKENCSRSCQQACQTSKTIKNNTYQVQKINQFQNEGFLRSTMKKQLQKFSNQKTNQRGQFYYFATQNYSNFNLQRVSTPFIKNEFPPPTKQQHLKFWRSSQKFSTNDRKNYIPKMFPYSNRLNSPPPYIQHFRDSSNEKNQQNSKLSRNFQQSFVQGNSLKNTPKAFNQKNFEISTTTQNNEKSSRSTMSLIQDLQLSDKNNQNIFFRKK